MGCTPKYELKLLNLENKVGGKIMILVWQRFLKKEKNQDLELHPETSTDSPWLTAAHLTIPQLYDGLRATWV